MHVNYEYVLAGIILLIVLSVAGINIVSIMSHQVTKMEQETDFPTSDRILDMLLMSPGNPRNWGIISDPPLSLGLAAGNALDAYILDSDKVRRLIDTCPNYLWPTEAREILGLSKDFNFNLTIRPVYDLLISNVSTAESMRYRVTVVDYNGLTVPSVTVTGYLVPSTLAEEGNYPSSQGVTGIDGNCILSFAPLQDRNLVVHAKHLKITSVQTYPSGLEVRVEGGYVMDSEFPIIGKIVFATSTKPDFNFETASRLAEIDGMDYFIRFDLWK